MGRQILSGFYRCCGRLGLPYMERSGEFLLPDNFRKLGIAKLVCARGRERARERGREREKGREREIVCMRVREGERETQFTGLLVVFQVSRCEPKLRYTRFTISNPVFVQVRKAR